MKFFTVWLVIVTGLFACVFTLCVLVVVAGWLFTSYPLVGWVVVLALVSATLAALVVHSDCE